MEYLAYWAEINDERVDSDFLTSRQGEIVDLKSKLRQASENFTQSLTSHNYVLSHESNERQKAIQGHQELDLLEKKLKPVLTARSSQGHACLEGTRTKPLEEIMAWSARMEALLKLFWLHGLAGSGKSSIAATVCEMLESKGMLAGTFFCKRDIPNQREPRLILPSLSYTLALLHKPYSDCVLKALEKEPDVSTRPVNFQLSTLFLSPFSELSLQQSSRDKPIVLVIDALDECGDVESRSQIAKCLCKIAALADWLKVFVISRPLPVLAREFSSNNALCLDLNTISADNDIMVYTKSCLKELVDAQSLDRKWLNDDTVADLSRRACGLFIWMSTVTRFIRGHYDQDDAMEMLLSDQHSDPGSSLDSLYRAVIQNSRGGKEAVNLPLMRAALGTIYSTSKNEPLSADGLYDLIPTLGRKAKFSRAALKAIIGDLRSVLYEDSSKGNVIRVCHPSFLDFIGSSERCGEYWTNPEHLNQAIIEICLNLMRTKLKFNICELESSYAANKDITELEWKVYKYIPESLRYCCLYWIMHYTKANDGTVKALILEVFRSPLVLYWLEVLSLINGLKKGVEALLLLANVDEVRFCNQKSSHSDEAMFRSATRSGFSPKMCTDSYSHPMMPSTSAHPISIFLHYAGCQKTVIYARLFATSFPMIQ